MNLTKLIMMSASVGAIAFWAMGSSSAHAMTQADLDAPASETQSNLVKVSVSEDSLGRAETFIDQMAQEGIAFLKDESMTEESRRAAFKTLLQNRFDLDRIGRFTLGKYWNEANASQQKEYLSLFRKMIVDVYSQRFSEYQGQSLKVKGARPEGAKDIVVNSVLRGAGSPDVRVDWRLREVSGQFKVIDVIVEGVSMAVTQRSDFASVIQRGGGSVDVLIDHLKGV